MLAFIGDHPILTVLLVFLVFKGLQSCIREWRK